MIKNRHLQAATTEIPQLLAAMLQLRPIHRHMQQTMPASTASIYRQTLPSPKGCAPVVA